MWLSDDRWSGPCVPCAVGAVEEWPVLNAESAENLARPIGRNQTKARIALVSLGVGIGWISQQ